MNMKKLLTFEDMGLVQWGVLNEEETGVYSAIALEEAFFTPLPETLLEFIRQGNDGLLALADALEQNEKEGAIEAKPLDTIRILAPIPHVERNIFCIGKNYTEHIVEFDKTTNPTIPKYPIIFTKATSSVIGPEDLINPHKNVTAELDYEGELAVIIGKSDCDIPISEAMDYVYGFTILNDVTARDLQRNHSQWFHGKSLDTFCPMGPYILLRDAAPDTFDVITKVNNEVRQDGSTGEFIFTISQLITTISQGTTLQAGDIIATGTPSGVGAGFNPPRYLHSGDCVEISISGIGTLKNKIK
ncbi:MAG: fumarylacetoacetate hydrolase family protein [Megasphaera sp.]|jgi:2-keto-4-pentenoate hydratase/2-oxohepta-3-ene-1,7-dioic acid hydratase in catechol pathway|nr:fumarylacetoacetate hydrolase family protein [Megasphaera sp.]MCI1824212.1 fumarylacetoacetate hydrolase family protein [Megasphaera sp.]